MPDRPLFILGAGVDKSLGFPLMNDLMFELMKIKDGSGEGTHGLQQSRLYFGGQEAA